MSRIIDTSRKNVTATITNGSGTTRLDSALAEATAGRALDVANQALEATEKVQHTIEAVATLRQEVDDKISVKVDKEATIREEVDTAEIGRATKAEAEIMAAVKLETQERLQGDKNIEEVLAQTTNQIEEQIAEDREMNSRAITWVNNLLNLEKAERENAEADINQQLKDHIANTTASLDKQQETLIAEQNRAIEAEKTLKTTLETRISETTDEWVEQLSTEFDAKLDVSVLTDSAITVSGDTVEVTYNMRHLNDDTTSALRKTLPIVSETTAGLMSYTTYRAIQDFQKRIGVLEGRTIRLLYTGKSNPNREDINQFISEIVNEDGRPVYSEPYEGIAIVVENHIWRYYAGDTGWHDDGVDTVNLFTNSVPGIVLGVADNDANAGKIYAEADGTASVIGWNETKAEIQKNKDDIFYLWSVTPKASYTEQNSGKAEDRNYGVQLADGNSMFVNVPWEDTHYSAYLRAGNDSGSSNQDTTAEDSTYLKICENGKVRSVVEIEGTGGIEITSAKIDNTTAKITIDGSKIANTGDGGTYTPPEVHTTLKSEVFYTNHIMDLGENPDSNGNPVLEISPRVRFSSTIYLNEGEDKYFDGTAFYGNIGFHNNPVFHDGLSCKNTLNMSGDISFTDGNVNIKAQSDSLRLTGKSGIYLQNNAHPNGLPAITGFLDGEDLYLYTMN